MSCRRNLFLFVCDLNVPAQTHSTVCCLLNMTRRDRGACGQSRTHSDTVLCHYVPVLCILTSVVWVMTVAVTSFLGMPVLPPPPPCPPSYSSSSVLLLSCLSVQLTVKTCVSRGTFNAVGEFGMDHMKTIDRWLCPAARCHDVRKEKRKNKTLRGKKKIQGLI